MLKQWFSGIFGFFFLRASFAVISFATVLLLVLFPFFKSQLIEMVKTQGASFANTTIAATASNLYKKEFGDALQYVQIVLKNTPDILFVVISDLEGNEIIVTAKDWRLTQNTLQFAQAKLSDNKNSMLYTETPQIMPKKAFLYHQRILITDVPWGIMSVALSDEQYRYILNRYLLTVISISVMLILALLVIFYSNAKKIRQQINLLSGTALNLQNGNLDAKAPEDSLGEIGLLGVAVNNMSSSLKEQSSRLFQLAQIVEQTNDAFILFDASKHIIFVNEAMQTLSGYPPSAFYELSIQSFTRRFNLDLDYLNQEFKWMSSSNQHSPARDVEIEQQNGELLYVEMRLESIFNSQSHEQHYLIVLSDISERKKLENELHHLAFFDKLTGLPNRRMFMDHLQKLIKTSHRHKKKFALFFMDLDNFKNINDSLGHEAGDTLLIEIGHRLKDLFRKEDLVTRLGGDEFTVLIENIADDNLINVANMAEKVIQQLAKTPIKLHGRNLTISTSLGIACYPDNGNDAESLVKHADMAMYSAKKSGKNRFAFFSDDMNLSLRKHLELENDMKDALLTGNEITLYYQPIMHLESNQIVGAEALARWHHPIKGFISPTEFITVAEMSNLIIHLSDQLLNIGFSQVHRWAQLHAQLYLSINISVRQFEQANFIDKLKILLNKYPINPNKIQLEFTEGIMLNSDSQTIHQFELLKQLGFQIAIDDFGTGYSSLGYIHKLPIDAIKIDRSFVAAMMQDKKAQTIVAAISSLSNSLEIKTIAEGVELEEHKQELIAYQCEFGQGYLYDKALPAEAFNQKYLRHDQIVHALQQ